MEDEIYLFIKIIRYFFYLIKISDSNIINVNNLYL